MKSLNIESKFISYCNNYIYCSNILKEFCIKKFVSSVYFLCSKIIFCKQSFKENLGFFY